MEEVVNEQININLKVVWLDGSVDNFVVTTDISAGKNNTIYYTPDGVAVIINMGAYRYYTMKEYRV